MPRGPVQQLLVRGPNWLGDAVMCEPALRSLRRLFPQASITLLVKPSVAGLFESHPAVDRIFLYDDRGRHAGWLGKWRLAGELRREAFDLAVLFQNAFEAALLAALAGIRRRYGYATDGRSLLLSEPVAPPDRRAPVHQVEYYWNLLKPLGLAGPAVPPELFVSADEERLMGERLAQQAGITTEDVVIGINPGSTYGGAKRWLPDRFAESTERLCNGLAVSGRRPAVVLLGAKGEEALGREIASRLTAPAAVFSGATTIRELMALIKRCAVLLTNDTGPMHIASAFRVPVVAVFGPTDWRTTSPYGEHALIRHSVECAPCMLRECPIDHRCMTGVTVERVSEAGLTMLSRRSDPLPQAQEGVTHTEPVDHQRVLDGYTIFLDRDGTLNEDPGYLRSASDVRLLPGVGAALARLKSAGARLVVVTNQSGVARGFLTLKDLEAIHARLEGLLEENDAPLDAIYFCPHHPDDGCRCRKPATGMIDRAVSELQVDLRKAYLVGDHASDIQLAKTVGAKAVLVTSGRVDDQALNLLRAARAMPDTVAPSMTEAVEWILKDASNRPHKAVAANTGIR